MIHKAIIVVLTLGAVKFADYTETFTEGDGVFIPPSEAGLPAIGSPVIRPERRFSVP